MNHTMEEPVGSAVVIPTISAEELSPIRRILGDAWDSALNYEAEHQAAGGSFVFLSEHEHNMTS